MNKVSIIMPAYNSQKYIEESIKSILNQSYNEIELIIVNDGSQDNTKEICKKLSVLDSRIIYKEIMNKGVSHARNVGLDLASGKYVMFIDSDDIYEKNMIEVMVDNIEGYECVCCDYKFFDDKNVVRKKKGLENGKYCGEEIYKSIEYLYDRQAFNIIWNKIYLLSIIRKNKIRFDESLNMGEDYRFNIDYFEKIKQMKIIKMILHNYRINSNGLSKKYSNEEFERRMSNLNYHKQLYIRKKFPITYIECRVINSFYASVVNAFAPEASMTKKERRNEIKKYLENQSIIEFSNSNTNLNIKHKIMRRQINKKRINVIYLISKILYLLRKKKVG